MLWEGGAPAAPAWCSRAQQDDEGEGEEEEQEEEEKEGGKVWTTAISECWWDEGLEGPASGLCSPSDSTICTRDSEPPGAGVGGPPPFTASS